MKDRARALIFHATSVPSGWRRVLFDTARARLPFGWASGGGNYETLSYVLDWRDAFAASPRLQAELVDINDALAFRSGLRRLRSVDLAVILHSALGDRPGRLAAASAAFQARSCRLLALVGNEHALLDEKLAFLRDVQADVIGSQLPLDSARWLYSGCERSAVVAAPHALNAELYRPLGRDRPVDVGFRGDAHSGTDANGDVRSRVLELFRRQGPAWGLRTDIEYFRLPRRQWCEFLNRCQAVVGAESGPRHLRYGDESASGRVVSSRHFEAIGTATCQILVEGRYNDILRADEHYLALREDFANQEDVLDRFRDPGQRAAVAARARDYVLASHTYPHRVESLLDQTLFQPSPPRARGA